MINWGVCKVRGDDWVDSLHMTTVSFCQGGGSELEGGLGLDEVEMRVSDGDGGGFHNCCRENDHWL